jgi:GNAT superfamily N-acetyltransferase
MKGIEYRTTGIDEIDCIRPLWERLNDLHHKNSPCFKPHYEKMSFEERKQDFRKIHLAGLLQVELAQDPMSAMFVGYCVCSVSPENTGSVESLFVNASYRSRGIGTTLVSRGLIWMDSHGVWQKRVSVAAGNESALPFYAKFGFVPRMMVLEQIDKTAPEPLVLNSEK